MQRYIRVFVKYQILSIISVFLYAMVAKYTYIERGYFALGGEVFILLLPLFYYLVLTIVRDAIVYHTRKP